MEFKIGDKVKIYNSFFGKVFSVEKGILLVKLDKGGYMNCHVIYTEKVLR